MQSAIKLAAYGLIVASFSKLGDMGAHALGVGHDEEGLVDYGALRVGPVSDLTNTADFSTVSTFPAIMPPEVTTFPAYPPKEYTPLVPHKKSKKTRFPPKEVTSYHSVSMETFMRREGEFTPATTTTRTSTITSTATETEVAPTKDTVTAVAPMDTSAPGAFTSVVTSYYHFTSTWASVITQTIIGTVSPSKISNSTQAVATSTSDFDGISSTATGTGAFPPGVSSGYAAGTDATGLYPSTTNSTWTAPVVTPTGSPVVSGAMGIKMAGAHMIGAAAVVAAVYLF